MQKVTGKPPWQKKLKGILIIDLVWWNFDCSRSKVSGDFSSNFMLLGQLEVGFSWFHCISGFPPNFCTCVITEMKCEFFVADTWLYTLPCRSVGRSVCNIFEFRAVFASLLLPNHPRLNCRVSGLVFERIPRSASSKTSLKLGLEKSIQLERCKRGRRMI